jgi:hypothetical protein
VELAACGYSGEGSEPLFAGGHWLANLSPFEGRELRYVGHSVPITVGDSGGPLVLTDGRLVGINAISVVFELDEFEPEMRARVNGPRGGLAARSDADWLVKLLDADRRTRSVRTRQ